MFLVLYFCKKKISVVEYIYKNKYKNKNMTQIDILEELDIALENTHTAVWENTDTTNTQTKKEIVYKYETVVIKKEKNKFFSITLHVWKYMVTSALIFAILLLGTNYSAYFHIAKSFIFSEEMKKTEKSILNSVEAWNLKKKITENIEETKAEEQNQKIEAKSIRKYKRDLDAQDLTLDIEITPYENRIVIPKMWKNIPLIDIKNREIKTENELEDILMKELEQWVVRYPSSAIPGEIGTSFIFWHSSNFPWMKGDYNDVFATLDNLVYGDEIIIYYNQKKYTYVIREKAVIKPGDVSVLKRNKNKQELSIMTCWPIWTTLNRLIVTWEIIEK